MRNLLAASAKKPELLSKVMRLAIIYDHVESRGGNSRLKPGSPLLLFRPIFFEIKPKHFEEILASLERKFEKAANVSVVGLYSLELLTYYMEDDSFSLVRDWFLARFGERLRELAIQTSYFQTCLEELLAGPPEKLQYSERTTRAKGAAAERVLRVFANGI